MHSILDLQADGPILEEDQAFEEGLGQARSCSFLVHNNGAELLKITKRSMVKTEKILEMAYLMISNKNNLLTPKNQGNHTF